MTVLEFLVFVSSIYLFPVQVRGDEGKLFLTLVTNLASVSVSFGVTMEAEADMTIRNQHCGQFWPNAQPRVCARVSVCMGGARLLSY